MLVRCRSGAKERPQLGMRAMGWKPKKGKEGEQARPGGRRSEEPGNRQSRTHKRAGGGGGRGGEGDEATAKEAPGGGGKGRRDRGGEGGAKGRPEGRGARCVVGERTLEPTTAQRSGARRSQTIGSRLTRQAHWDY